LETNLEGIAMQSATTEQTTNTLMAKRPTPSKRGRAEPAESPSPTSVRIEPELLARLEAIIAASVISKNNVLAAVIRLGIEQVEADSNLLLDAHMANLKDKKARKDAKSDE
jgi:hypothetical protein